MKVAVTAAVSRNGVIGSSGKLPWHLPSDLKHFREITTGHSVIMGRKTYESIPQKFRPLPDRTNIVISHKEYFIGCSAARSLEEALQIAEAEHSDSDYAFVIGGEQVYREALSLADELLITQVETDYDGDAYFPPIDDAKWHVIDHSELMTDNGIAFRFLRYRHDRSLLYWLPAARSEAQRKQMEELERADVCIFCPDSVGEHHASPIEFESKYWYVTANDFPYEGTLHHILIVPKRHLKALDELSPQEGAELFEVIGALKERYKPPTEAIVARSGNMQRNGGSVAHLHFHFVVGDTDNPEHESIRAKVSSRYPA